MHALAQEPELDRAGPAGEALTSTGS